MAEWKNSIAKITLPTPFPVGDVNVFLVKGDTLTLFDAGVKTEEAWNLFKSELHSLNLTPSDIEQVVLTHHHPDHVGLLDFLQVDRILGHEYCDRWIRRDEKFYPEIRSFYGDLFTSYGVPTMYHDKAFNRLLKTLTFSCTQSLTNVLSEGMRIPGLEDWIVLETFGHAQGHLSFWNEKERLLIGGDHILSTISSNPIIEPPLHIDMERPKPLLQYNESLRKMKQYEIIEVLAGHGNEVKQIYPLIDKRLARQHERAMKVKEIINGDRLNGFEICQRLFQDVYERELSLTMWETIGQLDYLESLNLLTSEIDENGVLYFQSV